MLNNNIINIYTTKQKEENKNVFLKILLLLLYIIYWV